MPWISAPLLLPSLVLSPQRARRPERSWKPMSDHRREEQEVNQPTRDVERHEAEGPQHEEHDCKSPKHGFILFPRVSSAPGRAHALEKRKSTMRTTAAGGPAVVHRFRENAFAPARMDRFRVEPPCYPSGVETAALRLALSQRSRMLRLSAQGLHGGEGPEQMIEWARSKAGSRASAPAQTACGARVRPIFACETGQKRPAWQSLGLRGG